MSLALSRLVRSLLSRPEAAKISFTLGGMMIGPSSFQLVKSNILSGKISVVYISSLGANVAKYQYKKNKLCLGFRASGVSADNEALIIHECVHAACDLSSHSVKVSLDEAVAYVAQCLYFYYRNEQALKTPGVRPTFTNPILREAWQVATLARSKKVLNDSDIQKLLRAISQHRLYSRTHSITKHYDG